MVLVGEIRQSFVHLIQLHLIFSRASVQHGPLNESSESHPHGRQRSDGYLFAQIDYFPGGVSNESVVFDVVRSRCDSRVVDGFEQGIALLLFTDAEAKRGADRDVRSLRLPNRTDVLEFFF